MTLTGRVALVSGAGGGIGRAISLAFVEVGAAVACCDIDLRSAEEIRAAFAGRDEGADRNNWLYSYNPLTVELI